MINIKLHYKLACITFIGLTTTNYASGADSAAADILTGGSSSLKPVSQRGSFASVKSGLSGGSGSNLLSILRGGESGTSAASSVAGSIRALSTFKGGATAASVSASRFQRASFSSDSFPEELVGLDIVDQHRLLTLTDGQLPKLKSTALAVGIIRLKESLDQKSAEIQELDAKCDAAEDRVKASGAEIAALTEKLAAALAKSKRLEGSLIDADKVNTELLQEKRAEETKVAALKEQLKIAEVRAEEEKRRLIDELAVSEKRFTTLHTGTGARIATLEEEVAALSLARDSALKETHAILAAEAEWLKGEIAAVESDGEWLAKELKKITGKTPKLSAVDDVSTPLLQGSQRGAGAAASAGTGITAADDTSVTVATIKHLKAILAAKKTEVSNLRLDLDEAKKSNSCCTIQ